MERGIGRALKSFVIELAVYAGLVAGYFFLVLHLLGDWLQWIFQDDRRLYAYLALLLIIAQGLLLELLTRGLLWLFKTQEEPP